MHVVQAGRREFSECTGHFVDRVGLVTRADMNHLVGLLLDGFHDRRVAVSEAEVESPRRAVHKFVTVLITDV